MENNINIESADNEIQIVVQGRGDNGVGIPTGGTTGQILSKKSNNDFDTQWTEQTGGTGNGNAIVSYLYQYQYDELVPDTNTFYVVDDSTPEIIYVTDVSLNKSSTTLVVGGTETLVATIIPSQATNKSVVWSSSDNNVATVSVNGLVTGISAGSATITVTTGDGNFVDTCSITVSQDIIAVSGVSLNKSSTSINIGATETLTATVAPSNATNKSVTWTSSNTDVATVSSGGVVTGVSAGSATITVTTGDGGYTANCATTVTANPALWQGSRTQNGVTIAISGNRIVMNGTKNINDVNSGGGCLSDSMPSPEIFRLNANVPTWHTFRSGDQITLKVTYVSGTRSTSNSNGIVYLRNTSNQIVGSVPITWNNLTSGTLNYTFTGTVAVHGLITYLDVNQALSDFTVDVEFTVNGERWI